MEEHETSSKFNAGILQTQRIDKDIQLINFCNTNPMAWNEDYLDWNYIIRFNTVENLSMEIIGYINEKEYEALMKIRDKIKDMIKTYPVYDNKKKLRNANKKNMEVIDEVSDIYFRRVMKLGFKYQILGAYKQQAGRI